MPISTRQRATQIVVDFLKEDEPTWSRWREDAADCRDIICARDVQYFLADRLRQQVVEAIAISNAPLFHELFLDATESVDWFWIAGQLLAGIEGGHDATRRE